MSLHGSPPDVGRRSLLRCRSWSGRRQVADAPEPPKREGGDRARGRTTRRSPNSSLVAPLVGDVSAGEHRRNTARSGAPEKGFSGRETTVEAEGIEPTAGWAEQFRMV